MLLTGLKRGLSGLAAIALLALSAQAQPVQRTDAVGVLLNEWLQAGTAAGLAAITYENRDGQHSPLNAGQYPDLQIFQPDAKSGPPTGPAMSLRMKPTVGNCSMAAPADKGGSLPRMYQMDPSGQKFLMMQYLANNLMIYPEHQDHDIGGNGVGGYGDLFPTNNACTLISQGSSGSDQPFLNAVLSSIAAFPPDTQRLLIEKRILMPTVQAILRQSSRLVKKEADYFTGAAHPVVFDAASLDEEKMVRAAHDMRPPMIPPLAQIEVLEETELKAGKHFFEVEKPHPYKLADTPVSVARLMRGNEAEFTLVLSGKKSADLMGRPVELRWQLLQGDARFVRVETSDRGMTARLHMRWQPPMKGAGGIRSHRVDIGLFASNGISTSTPALVSFYMLPNERHFYDEAGRVSEICYQTFNPDLGLPADNRDARWLKAMVAVSLAGDGLRSRLMEKLLPEAERLAIPKAWLPLDKRWRALQADLNDADKKELADKMTHRLLDDLDEALRQILPGGRGLTTRAAIEGCFDEAANFTDLFTSFQKDLLALAAKSPKATALADVKTEVARLKDWNVLLEEANGMVTTSAATQMLSEADRYYLRGLNLTLLSQVLFPEVLERSTAPAWVDARLTTPKPWRDVFRYDKDGQLIGWIRHQAGRTHWFDAEGLHLPDGPGPASRALPVVYVKNAQGLLEWRAP